MFKRKLQRNLSIVATHMLESVCILKKDSNYVYTKKIGSR